MGPLIAILSTISFGLTDALTRRGLERIPASFGIYISIFIGIPLLTVTAALTGQLFDLRQISTNNYFQLAGAGLIHFLVGRYTLYRCFAAIGANRAVPITSLSVPLTLLMAIILLGERISAINFIGIVVVMLAPMIMLQPSDNGGGVGGTRLAEGYLFGLATALAFGCSPLLIRGAIGDTGLGVAGTLVAYLAASIPLLFSLALSGTRTSFQGLDQAAVRWFLLSGVTVFFASMFRFIAFDLAPVTVVEPLMRTGAIWTVIFAYLINRRLEAFGVNVLASIALAIVGSVFVVV